MGNLIENRLHRKGPKRILALDGGGVRGMVTLGILERIEALLRERSGREGFRLCDYFDLIAGTSTGSIIAVALSLGMSVSEINQLYTKLAPAVFKKSKPRKALQKIPGWKYLDTLARPRYRRSPLIEALEEEFARYADGAKKMTLEDGHIRTGLLVLIQRLLPKGHVWAVLNNPTHRFFKHNRKHPLSQLIRASTAAPSFFEPERLQVGSGADDSWFIDGGVSPFNNPALAALFVATMNGFGLKWPLGEDKLMIVSVGTGFRNERVTPSKLHAKIYLPAMNSLMEECNWLTQAVLQWLSESPTSWRVHGGTEALDGDLLGGTRWLTYLRYSVELGRRAVRLRKGEEIAKYLKETELRSLIQMDNPRNLSRLLHIGKIVGEREVIDTHFSPVFD